MTAYVWNKGRWRDRKTGAPMPLPAGDEVRCPMVHSDIAEYRSPIDGRLITSRSQRREDLERNACVEADPPPHRRGYRNPRFALKRGLPLRGQNGLAATPLVQAHGQAENSGEKS
jgi:hypothetical protein